jgi:NADH:ubiquinone oxidoreductase subunit 3 (subunit A)
MEDPAYYKSRYNITVFYVIPFLSPAESPLSAIFPWAEYSFGISLACIIFIIAIILSILYLLNFFTSLKNSDNQKMSSYECGFEPIHTNARIKFDVLYWIIGILYLIFDLEIIFIFPLATIIQTLQNPFALFVYLFFIIILTLGFIYEWKKGALKLNQKS